MKCMMCAAPLRSDAGGQVDTGSGSGSDTSVQCVVNVRETKVAGYAGLGYVRNACFRVPYALEGA